MARLIKVSYAGLTIGLGGDASITLTDRYRCSYDYTSFNFEAVVVVRSATRSTFLTAEAALIAAWRKPDQDLDVELGGTNRHSFAASDNTGFSARATCSKVDDDLSTANSARYRIGVVVQLPADLSGRDGRQSASVSVEATPAGQRTVTIEGVYTALSSNSAVAQYVAAGTTYCDSVISAIGGTYELLTPVNTGSGFGAAAGFTYDDQNKILRFKRVYEEVIFRQSTSSTDVSAIKRPSLLIERTTPPDGSDPDENTRPLERFRAVYRCMVDKNITTDLASLYTGTVRPLILAEVNSVSGATCVVESESVSYEPTGNGLSAAITFLADYGAEFFQFEVVDEDLTRPGEEFAPVWSGDGFDVDLYKVPKLHIKTITRTYTARTEREIDPLRRIPELPGFREIEQLRREVPKTFGVTGDPIPYRVVVHTFTFRRVNVSSTTSSGPGASPSSDTTGGGTRTRDPEAMRALGLSKYK